MEYITNLLRTFGVELPPYLTTLLIHNGFDNVYSLSQLNIDQDVEKIECYAREVLSKVLKGEEKKAIFGIFTEECSLFKIPEGHKKLLTFIKEESAKKINLAKRPLNLESSNSCFGEGCSASFSRKKAKLANKGTSQSETNNEDHDQYTPNNDGISQQALQHVINVSQNYIEKFSREEFRQGKITNDELKKIIHKCKSMEVKMDGDLSAKISCPLCSFISSAYSVKNSKTGRKWVISNFLRHFRTHFKKDVTSDVTSSKKLPAKTQTQPNITNFMKKTDLNKNDNSSDVEETLIDLTNDEIIRNTATTLAANNSSTSDFTRQNKIITNNSDEKENFNPTDTQISLDDEEPLGGGFSEIDISVSRFEDFSEDFPLFDDNILELGSSMNNDMNNAISEKPGEKSQSQAKKTQKKSVFGDSNSRRERGLRVLNELPYNQEQITTFLNVLNNAIDRNPEITSTLNIITQNQAINKLNFDAKGLLKHLLDSAIKNSKNKSVNANKFDEGMKRFWLYIFIAAGRMTYEILCSNLPKILPSVSTIYRQLEEMDNILEGAVRIEDLKTYLQKRNYPPMVFISEDQTALIKKVQYDPSTNQMIGFVAPLQEDTRFPKIGHFSVNSVKDIETAFKNETLAINAYVFMAQPLVDGSPAFCISIFGSDNRFTSDDVFKRWQYIVSEAAKHGITVLGFSSDGDTRCLKSMKISSKLPLLSENPYFPYFQADYNLENPTVLQDTIHISTKLKTRLLNEDISMNIGGKKVSINNIRYLIENYSRDKHLLCKSFLESSDKMNFNAIDKMSSEVVTNLLKESPNAEATRQYLILTRNILNAFLLKELPIEKRVYLIWYTTFFMRIWKFWLKESGEKIQKSFITSNTYTCIELNAHGIILVIEKLRQSQMPQAFVPWLLSSQPCEKIFRETRSMSSTFSTMINYSLLEILRRLKRIQAMHEISTDLGTDFRFPRQENKRLGNDTPAFKTMELPGTDAIIKVIENAKQDALVDANQLGMKMDSDLWMNVNLPLSKNSTNYPEEDAEVVDNITSTDTASLTADEYKKDFSKEDREFLEYSSTFTSLDSLQLKDYSGQRMAEKSCLALTLNDNKIRIIKKSTLIWFFQENQGRLSTDRILRVKGMSIKKTDRCETNKSQKLISKRKNKNPKIHQDYDDSTSESESDINYASDTLTEDFSDLLSDLDETSKEVAMNISIKLECYYAIYYDARWYLGRVIGRCQPESFKVKFLQHDLDTFKWPKKDDIQEVHQDFIFYGPVTLLGSEPFSLKRNDMASIQKKYKELKSEH